MQAKKDTQKKLLFKFVDEESDDYFKRSDEKEVQYDGGSDDDKNKKMAMIVAGVVIVGLLVGFFALRGGDETDTAGEEAAGEDPLETPNPEPNQDTDGDGTNDACADETAPDSDGNCTLAQQGYTLSDDGAQITDTADVTEATLDFCNANENERGDQWCLDAYDAAATYVSALAAPSKDPVAATDDQITDLVCFKTQAVPEDATACTLEEQGYAPDGANITDADVAGVTSAETEPAAQFCAAYPDYSADDLCADATLEDATLTPYDIPAASTTQ